MPGRTIAWSSALFSTLVLGGCIHHPFDYEPDASWIPDDWKVVAAEHWRVPKMAVVGHSRGGGGRILIDDPGYYTTVTPDGTCVAHFCDSGKIVVVSIDTGQQIAVFPGFDPPRLENPRRHRLEWSPDSRWLLLEETMVLYPEEMARLVPLSFADGSTYEVWSWRGRDTPYIESAWLTDDRVVLQRVGPKGPSVFSVLDVGSKPWRPFDTTSWAKICDIVHYNRNVYDSENEFVSPSGRWHIEIREDGLCILDRDGRVQHHIPATGQDPLWSNTPGTFHPQWDRTERYLFFNSVGDFFVYDLETRRVGWLMSGWPPLMVVQPERYKPILPPDYNAPRWKPRGPTRRVRVTS